MDTPLFEQPESTIEMAALADIEPWSASGAKSATAKSIEALGLRGTVTLQRLAPGSRYRYRVIDGHRRLNTAREGDLEHVQAEVLPEDTGRAEAAALRLASNLGRSPNPMQEAEAVQELSNAYVAAGVPEVEVIGTIARDLGISVNIIRQRTRLIELLPALQQGVRNGKVAAGVAAKIANLPRAQQAQLATDLETNGKLTANDVHDVRRVKQEASLAELPENLFAPIADDPEVRAKVVLTDFMDEGLSAERLVSLVQEVSKERKVF